MATMLINSAATAAGPVLFLAAPGGAWRVTARLQSTEDVAILGIAPGLRLTVAAPVLGSVAAVALGEISLMQLGARMTVAASGQLSGAQTGLLLTGQGNALLVEGRIWGGQTGVLVAGQGAGTTAVTNRGEITGARAIARDTGTDTETLRIDNAGRITGTLAAFDGGSAIARDVIVNSGQMAGGLRLGGGDDRYEARGEGHAGGMIQGGAGDDGFVPGVAVERFSGGSGTDWIIAPAGPAPLTFALDGSFAAAGVMAGDRVTGIEALRGSATGADRLAGRALADTLAGGGGNDSLWGRAGQDLVQGGAGDDRLWGEAGDDTLAPGTGADRVDGGDGQDIVDYTATAGAVTVDLAAGRATGAAGSDSLTSVEGVLGGAGDDALTGDAGQNLLRGGLGHDRLAGGDGADSLDGSAGDDRLAGGPGSDWLAGGDGADAFVFDLADPGADRIADWTAGDRFHLAGTGMATGPLAPGAFHRAADGTAATGAHRLILGGQDHGLWWDPDGAGPAAPRLLAWLPQHAGLTAADVLLV